MAPRKKKATEDTPPSGTKMDLTRKFEYKMYDVSGNLGSTEIERISALGLEGWELVQTLKNKSDRTFIFKREL